MIRLGTIHLRRLHVLGGDGCPHVPMFADARGLGVLGLPTSAIFEIINLHYRLLYVYTITLFYFGEYLLNYIIGIINGKFLIIL